MMLAVLVRLFGSHQQQSQVCQTKRWQTYSNTMRLAMLKDVMRPTKVQILDTYREQLAKTNAFERYCRNYDADRKAQAQVEGRTLDYRPVMDIAGWN